jgi:hypothetical protein
MKLNRIFKYNLGIPCMTERRQIIDTGDYAIVRILDIQLQGDNAVMWAEVTPYEGGTHVTVEAVWTGECAPDTSEMAYIATVQERTGLVYHYYVYNPYSRWDL